MSDHATQNLVLIRKKIILSGVSSEFKDLDKFAEDTDSHVFGDELEDSLKKAKGAHYSLQALNLRQTTRMLLSENSMKLQKTTGQPKDPWLATRESHKKTPQIYGQN